MTIDNMYIKCVLDFYVNNKERTLMNAQFSIDQVAWCYFH